MNEINYCPFCGGCGVAHQSMNNKKYYVRCNRCGAQTRQDFITREDAIKSWNMRKGGKNEVN